MVSMATNIDEQSRETYMADTRLFKKHFYKSFVKMSAIAWQYMPFQFSHCKTTENLNAITTKLES